MTEFTADWVSKKVDNWTEILAEFVGRPNVKALEIGSYEGRSACWFLDHVLTGDGATLDCVDSWAGDTAELGQQAIPAEALFDRNTASYGPRLRKHKRDSFEWLLDRNRQRPVEKYDFIYVDGGHAASQTLKDLTLSWPLLRPGGVFICDDYQWEHPFLARLPRDAIDAFFSCRGDWDVLRDDLQFIVRKSVPGIEAVVVCVDYADYLAETLPHLASRVDRVVVVTSEADEKTPAVVESHPNVRCVATNVFFWNEADFNKGAGINAGLAHLERTGWVLHIDADIALLDSIPVDLDRHALWTTPRRRVVGDTELQRLLDGERSGFADMTNVYLRGDLIPSGYFQLWHWPTCQCWYPENSKDASRSDMGFAAKWKPCIRRFIPDLTVYHLETPDQNYKANWRGRRTMPFGGAK